MLYVFLALALLSGCALTYAASGFTSLAALWQVPVFFLGSFLAFVVLFLLVVLVSCLFVDPKKLLEKPSGYFRFLLNEFCRIALALGGVHVNVTGLEKVPREGRFLLVSNHRFAFDPIVFYAVMPWAELAFLSKKENFSIFIVAQFMREVLCLPLDRENDREAPSSRPSSLSRTIRPPSPCSRRAGRIKRAIRFSPTATARSRSRRRQTCPSWSVRW